MNTKKFRFWDGKKMHYYGFVILPNGQVRVGDEVNWTNGFLMVDTGIKDKKGNHIYEMDITNHKGFGKGIIKFHRGGFVQQDALLEEEGTGGSLWQNREVQEESEIIGNVFENPLLLQKLLV